MSVKISDLLQQYDLSKEAKVIRDYDFDNFARATTAVDGKKCMFVADKKYLKGLDSSVAMVITTEEIADLLSEDIGVCLSDNPRGLFFELLSVYEKGEGLSKFDTVIGNNCDISSTAIISPYNVVIGDNVKIDDFVIIRPNTTIGDNVTIQSGAKIAEQDFNVYQYKGVTKQVYHNGKVVIGSNVLISSGVLIGQALYSYGKTAVGDNCFIGAGTCIGHNTEIDSGCEICGNSMLGGYSKIGKDVKIFMTVTIANTVKVGDKAVINMGSVVVRDVLDGKTMFGNPAREIVAPKNK